MADISSISAGLSPATQAAAVAAGIGRTADRGAPASIARGGDQVELSQLASVLQRLRNLPVREELVDRVRQEVAQGQYDTPEKLDAALDELLRDESELR